MTNKECAICGNQEAEYNYLMYHSNGKEERRDLYVCPDCGAYLLYSTSLLPLQLKDNIDQKKYYLSCYLYETRDKHVLESPVEISDDLINRILEQRPRTVEDKIKRLLRYVNDQSSFFGKAVALDKKVIYSIKDDELDNLSNALIKQGLLENCSPFGFRMVSISISGIEFLMAEEKEVKNDKCFVAMWFNDEINDVYDKSIVPACKMQVMNRSELIGKTSTVILRTG